MCGIRLGLQWNLGTLDKPVGFLVIMPSGVRFKEGFISDTSDCSVSMWSIRCRVRHGLVLDGSELTKSITVFIFYFIRP